MYQLVYHHSGIKFTGTIKYFKMAQDNFKSIGKYFSLEKPFEVPYYQRGYKWSLQLNEDKQKTHFQVLLEDLKTEFDNKSEEYFLQGVTVKERDTAIELVDGQQRTTSLFILLCALRYRGASLDMEGKEVVLSNRFLYKVRQKANQVMQGFIEGKTEECSGVQDMVALNRAWNESLKFIDELGAPQAFATFLLCRVQLIYIVLDENQSEIDTFSMMNEDKAVMTKTDLVKANLLREASRQAFKTSEVKDGGLEWHINHLRTRLASEWDEWRKWWEEEQHFSFAGRTKVKKEKDIEEPNLSGLLLLYYKKETGKELRQSSLFEEYKKLVADKEDFVVEATQVFDGLRMIQKALEEWYEDHELFNHINLLFKGTGSVADASAIVPLLHKYENDKAHFLSYLKESYVKKVLDFEEGEMALDEAKEKFVAAFKKTTDVYTDPYYYYRFARQLLRMNVMRVNKQKLKFDFSLYVENFESDAANKQMRSLEHIAPQSPKEEAAFSASEQTIQAISQLINLLKKEEGNSSTQEVVKSAFAAKDSLGDLIHSIGNFVLIPKGLNSVLSNRPFQEKKELLFTKMVETKDANYGLWLHTLEVFGKNTKWEAAEIQQNKQKFIQELESFLKSETN